MTYNELCHRLSPLYGDHEARAIVRLVLEEGFDLTSTDVYMGKVSQLSADSLLKLEEFMQRLEKSEPVQYVLGQADFCGRTFSVRPGVLIPRPETQLLLPMVGRGFTGPFSVLDIGTGSGCIAITAALDNPQAQVTAWDVSPQALLVAAENGRRLGAQVSWCQQDVLHAPDDHQLWDVIVSNPPYICERERGDMAANVLDYEPALALFVPDAHPLLFYHAIGRYARHALRPSGRLCLEINPHYADELAQWLGDSGFTVNQADDQYGRRRFIQATLCDR